MAVFQTSSSAFPADATTEQGLIFNKHKNSDDGAWQEEEWTQYELNSDSQGGLASAVIKV